jgi:hypothetical protein
LRNDQRVTLFAAWLAEEAAATGKAKRPKVLAVA